jgi:hypothetical protein
MQLFSKEDLIKALRAIRSKGWIPNARPGNTGGVGNTLEDLLGIKENNLPIPNAAEWELKCQRQTTISLTTLFHMEPSPRGLRIVPNILLPRYGWAHQKAGSRYTLGEMSFRQTINGASRTDRGFGIVVDRKSQRVLISFSSSEVSSRHKEWLKSVEERTGLGELNPQPYWGFQDLSHKAGTKLLNCFYVIAEVERKEGREYFRYSTIKMLQRFSPEKLIAAIEKGQIFIDFDARSGHNHGTKFRARPDIFPQLYELVTEL